MALRDMQGKGPCYHVGKSLQPAMDLPNTTRKCNIFYAKQFPLGVKLNPQGYIITLVIAWNLQLIAYSLVLTQIAKVISYSLDC